jgi:hypothetical protein
MCKLNLQLQCVPATHSRHAVQEQHREYGRSIARIACYG